MRDDCRQTRVDHLLSANREGEWPSCSETTLSPVGGGGDVVGVAVDDIDVVLGWLSCSETVPFVL